MKKTLFQYGTDNNKFIVGIYIYIISYISTINYWAVNFGDNNVIRMGFYGIIIFSVVIHFLYALEGKKICVLFLVYFFYLAWCTLSFLRTESTSLEAIYPYVILPLIMISSSFFLKAIDYKFLLKIIITSTTFLSFLSIYEYVTHSYILYRPGDEYRAFRCKVFADSCLSLGCQLAIGVILCVSMARYTKKKSLYIVSAINLTGLLFTQSRGPLVGCFVGLVLIFLYDSIIRKKLYRIFLSGIIFVLLVVIFLVLANSILLAVDNPIILRILSIFNWTSDFGNIERLYKWKIYLNIFKEAPFLGKGIGFVDANPNGVTESGILQQLVEIGIIGTSLYYYFVVLILKKGWNYTKTQNMSDNYLVIGLIAACVCVLTENIVLQIFDNTIIGTLFWIFISMIREIVRSNMKNSEVFQQNTGPPSNGKE